MRRSLATFLGVVVWMTATSTLASDQVSEQIVVIRLPSEKSRVTVHHQRGDSVALLEALNPPAELVATLRAQTGRFFRNAERREFVNERGLVSLDLSSSAVEISTKPVDKTPAVILTFKQGENPLHPDHRALFGAIPGLYEVGRLPATWPSEPADAPCPGRIANERLAWTVPAEHVDERFALVDDQACAHYLAANLAIEAINSGRSLAPFERWAFNFDTFDAWPEHRRTQAMVTLVAGYVLVRTGYEPEAEVLLGDPKMFRAQSLQYHQAVGLAHLELIRARVDAVRQIVDPLLETSAPKGIKEVAGIIAVLAETRAGRPRVGLEIAQTAWDASQDATPTDGKLAALAGEIALAIDDHALARTWFERASRSSNGPAMRAAFLRLSDFEARKGRFRSAKRILARTQPKSVCEIALVELRKKIMSFTKADEVLRYLEGVMKQPACDAERREAEYALTRTYVQVGLPEMAVPLAWSLREGLPKDYLHTTDPPPMLRDAFREAAARLRRHQRWLTLIDLYETHVAAKKALELLDGPTLLNVARAYIESGAPKSAGTVLTLRLASGVDDEARREIAETLIEAYLLADDLYRADLVLSYFEKSFGSELPYVVAMNRSRLDLRSGEPRAAIARLASLQTPGGDPQWERLELLGRAHFEAGDLPAAVEALNRAVQMPNPAEFEHPETVVRVLSECARRDASGPCAELYRGAARRMALSDRLQSHALRLGWIAGADAQTDEASPRELAEMLVRSTEETED